MYDNFLNGFKANYAWNIKIIAILVKLFKFALLSYNFASANRTKTGLKRKEMSMILNF